MRSTPAVELDGAVVGYGGTPVIDRLSLRIEVGEIVGLLGPNGSGKSTLVRGLLGLAPVTAGSVRLFGVERERFRDWSRIGYVPQRATVTGGIPATVREVVATGTLGRVRPFPRLRARDRDRVDRAIAAVDLSAKAGSPIGTLSGGQQRRALIARALASDADLLVLDEPTAGVDAENQIALARIFEDLRARGTTILLITHELGPADRVVERTLVLEAGRLVYDGAAADAPSEHHLAGGHHHDHHAHDDAWHHDHGDAEPPRPGLGLQGPT